MSASTTDGDADAHELALVPVLQHGVHEQLFYLGREIRLPWKRAIQRLHDGIGAAFQDGQEQAALPAEVAVDEALGAASTLGDLARRCGVEALFGEGLGRGINEAALALIPIVFAAFWGCWFGGHR